MGEDGSADEGTAGGATKTLLEGEMPGVVPTIGLAGESGVTPVPPLLALSGVVPTVLGGSDTTEGGVPTAAAGGAPGAGLVCADADSGMAIAAIAIAINVGFSMSDLLVTGLPCTQGAYRTS